MLSLNIKPPHDPAAERSVLGTMLADPDNIPVVLEYLTEEDFYIEEHKLLFNIIVKLWQEHGNNWDEVILGDYIRKEGLEERLPFEWILGIYEEAAPINTLETACRIVKEKAGLRSVLELSVNLIKDVKELQDFNTIIEVAQSKIFEISEKTTVTHYHHIKDVAREVIEIIDKFRKTERLVTGLSTGFTELDMMTTGFHPSDLIVLAARPGMGKTSFMLTLVSHAAFVEEKPVAIFSLEMSKEQLVMRLLSGMAEVPLQKLRSGFITDDEREKLLSAALELSKAEIYIDDTPALTTTELRVKSRKLKKEKGIEFIAVDYLQMLRSPVRKSSRQEEVAEISRNLKALAKELSIPVLALAQLSRQVEHRSDRRPQLADLRESGQIEQDADLIIFLHRPEYYKKNPSPEEKGIAEVIVAKQRQGPTGIIKVAFIKDFAKFASLTTPVGEAEEEIFEEEESFSDEDYDLDF
ncbi:replicative DNA helicase [Hydrogenivirga caldilitoris]|uniref:Replicative DNA helicase n=1 Tax=Hydrogenivirga caldilitoris TaxID=246264 RepID=A0A497XVE9_9AQUI|nr:replicative DNA helicase [Hydrogenivirga caldilitoris]RLJ71122.1 replicative DNA helicase [Hydrogenivirga caldilitoris]